jgi:YesN/AraC family two-component response regulator
MDERFRQELNSYWSTQKKLIPERPANPEVYTVDDIRHWYDMEFAGWHISKNNLPVSPKNGVRNKRIFYFLPGSHVYLNEYASTLCGLASAYEAELFVLNAGWSHEKQHEQVLKSLKQSPDMIVILPVNLKESTSLYKIVNQSGTPVIAGNFLPDDEGINPSLLHKFVVSGEKTGLKEFYENLFNKLIHAHQISTEHVQGFLLELVAVLLRILRENDLPVQDVFESYEYLYKRLFHQSSILHSVLWLENISMKVLIRIDQDRMKHESVIGKVIQYIQLYYKKPISIKILADNFHLSAGYLGR